MADVSEDFHKMIQDRRLKYAEELRKVHFIDLFNDTSSPIFNWPKCECGAETAGYDTHSHWCPKYVKP